MARFIAHAQCGRGEATRVGASAKAAANGWDIGGKAEAEPFDKEHDLVSISITSGSNQHRPTRLIAQARSEGTIVIWHPITQAVLYKGPLYLTE